MQTVGGAQDADARALVIEAHSASPYPGLLFFDPDDLSLLAKTAFNITAQQTLEAIRGVLSTWKGRAPAPAGDLEAHDHADPAQAALLDLEVRLRQADEAQVPALAGEIQAWLDGGAGDRPETAPLAWLLLGQARYLVADFQGANAAWGELVRRYPKHPLRHRAEFHMLDHGVWPEAAHPDIRRARLPGVEDTGIVVPDPAVRARNLARVRADPRFRWSPSGVPFVEIPAGTFVMGGDPPGSRRELPLRRVTISRPFLLAAWPVTRALWRRF